MRIPDAKVSMWATVLIAVLPLLTLLGTVIWYEATTASNVAHCMHAIESHEDAPDIVRFCKITPEATS